MFLPIKAIIDRRPRKDGTAVISIQYCFSSDKRTLLFTGLAVPPRFWNRRLLRISHDLPSEFGKADQLNLQLQKMVRTAEDIVSFALDQKLEDPVGYLKKVFHPDFESANISERHIELLQAETEQATVNLDFFYQLDDYIKAKSRKVCPGMLRSYRVMKNRLPICRTRSMLLINPINLIGDFLGTLPAITDFIRFSKKKRKSHLPQFNKGLG